MAKRLVWKMPDGSIDVTTPVGAMIPAESDEEYAARVIAESGLTRRLDETPTSYVNRLVLASKLERLTDPETKEFAESVGAYVRRMINATGLLPIPAETNEEFLARAMETTKAVQRPAETEEEYLARIAARLLEPKLNREGKIVSKYANAERLPDIDHTELPDRRFRECWRHEDGAVKPNADLARVQVLAEVRAKRNQLLTASDALKAQVEETGTKEQLAAVLAYRQELRDLPTGVEDAIKKIPVDDLVTYTPDLPAVPVRADAIEAEVAPAIDALSEKISP